MTAIGSFTEIPLLDKAGAKLPVRYERNLRKVGTSEIGWDADGPLLER